MSGPDDQRAVTGRAAPPPTPDGPRSENVLLWLLLVADLVSNPFHCAVYLVNRSRIRRALQRALSESAS